MEVKENNDYIEMVRKYKEKALNKELERVFSKEVFENKYILWIFPEIYFPFSCEIKGEIEILKSNEKLEIPVCKLRTLYPNKNWKTLCLKNKRKLTQGIPLFFDSFEKLLEVKKLKIHWKSNDLVEIFVHYDLSFAKVEGKKIYTLHTSDLTYIENKKMSDEHENSFDRISSGFLKEWTLNYYKNLKLVPDTVLQKELFE